MPGGTPGPFLVGAGDNGGAGSRARFPGQIAFAVPG